MGAEFEIYRRGDEYRWRLRNTHHQVEAFGRGQPTLEAAIRDIEAMRRAIADADIKDRTGDE